MKLSQLRHFLAVVEHGNFHRAAHALNVTQQALSASVGKLEDILGELLLDRGLHGVTVTPSGGRLAERARLICSEAWRAEQEIREYQNASIGSVRIGVGGLFTEGLIPAALAGYLRNYPNLDVTLVEGNSKEVFTALCRGEIDFSLSSPLPELQIPHEIEHEELFRIPFAVHMRVDHPLAHVHDLDIAGLVGAQWVVSAADPAQAEALSAAFVRSGLPAPIRFFRADSCAVVRYLVAGNDYLLLGANPPHALTIFSEGSVTARDIPEFRKSTAAVLAWRKSTPMLPAAARLMSHVRDTYRALGKDDV